MAALLHYLFLSAFCWMLCEGIMLYLLLIVVFSEMSKKWWPFLIIGYGKTNVGYVCVSRFDVSFALYSASTTSSGHHCGNKVPILWS